MAVDDDGGAIRGKLLALERKYAATPKRCAPHPDIGCWWALYDYGLEAVRGWAPDHKHPYPGEQLREWGGHARRGLAALAAAPPAAGPAAGS